MIFKDRKIPKHLIIEDNYEISHRPKFNFLKLLFLTLLLSSLAYALILIQQ